MLQTRLKDKMGPIIEHNTQTYHHAMALGGLARLAAPESLLTESTPLPRRPFPTDVTLCEGYDDKKLRINCCDTTANKSCFKSKNVFNAYKS
jgi:hypothetical protein